MFDYINAAALGFSLMANLLLIGVIRRQSRALAVKQKYIDAVNKQLKSKSSMSTKSQLLEKVSEAMNRLSDKEKSAEEEWPEELEGLH